MSSITSSVDAAVSEFVANGLELIGTDKFDNLKGSKKGDLIRGFGESDLLSGGKGRDLIDGGIGTDIIKAGKGKDIVIGGDDDDTIFGNKGKDLIDGGAGNDTIFGGAGNDTIFGGSGSDLMFGNSGADVFEFNVQNFNDGSTDKIENFNLEKDKLVIQGLSTSDEVLFDYEDAFVYLNGMKVIDLSGFSDGNRKDMDINENENFELF